MQSSEEKRIVAVHCQQGEVVVLVHNHMSSYRELNGGKLLDCISSAGDISLIVVDNVPEFLKEAMWAFLEIAIVDHGATDLFIFGHTPCLMRKKLGADGEDVVEWQLFAASEAILERFSQYELTIKLFLVKIDESEGWMKWDIKELQ